MSFISKFGRRLLQPSSLNGVSLLSILGLLIPEIVGRGERVGQAVTEGAQAGVEAGSQAAAAGVDTPTAIILGAVAGVTAALGIIRDDKSDRVGGNGAKP